MSVHAHTIENANKNNVLGVSVISPLQLIANEKNKVTLMIRFKETGKPATPDTLKTAHTEKVHLLINNPNLSDYHHIHPTPGNNPGEYVFSFIPRTSTDYRIWADIVPKDGKQEYIVSDLKGSTDGQLTKHDKQLNRLSVVDGKYYELTLEPNDIVAKGMAMGNITVKDISSGELFSGLESIMEEFAHLVGFYEDYITIAHIHPMGPSPKSESDRGGPVIKFHIGANQPGFMKLYQQVQINGEQQFASFGLQVKPASN